VVKLDEQRCPIHHEFLRLQGARLEPLGSLIVQEPVPVSWWGCPSENCNYEVHHCPHCRELLAHTSSVGPGMGAYKPGEPPPPKGYVHHFRCAKCERTYMLSASHRLHETGHADATP